MIAAIHQPQFMPWLGYFDKMGRADVFVLLDTVQFKKNEWQNRNRIKTPQGPQWLTVPVRHAFPSLISQVEVQEQAPWRRKHLQALRANYARAPFWSRYEPDLVQFYEREWKDLAAVNRASIEWLAGALGIEGRLRLASQMEAGEDPSGRLVDLCRQVGADLYLSGPDGRKYLELAAFEGAGIEVVFHAYEHPAYAQLHGAFESHLSALDLLLNCGEEGGKILLAGGKIGR